MHIKTLRFIREALTWGGYFVTAGGVVYSIVAKGISPGTYISLVGLGVTGIGHITRIAISRIEVSARADEKARYDERIERLESEVEGAKRYTDSPHLKKFIEGEEHDEAQDYFM